MWAVGLLAFWRARRWLRYHALDGDFDAKRKGSGEIEWRLSIKVVGNRLVVTGRNDEGRSFRGEIVMSDELAGSGRGQYYRDDDPDAYGFWEVQVVNKDRILVHETYSRPSDLRAIVSGFAWIR